MTPLAQAIATLQANTAMIDALLHKTPIVRNQIIDDKGFINQLFLLQTTSRDALKAAEDSRALFQRVAKLSKKASALFPEDDTRASNLQKLAEKDAAAVFNAGNDYKAAMTRAMQHIEIIKKHNAAVAQTIDIPKTLNTLACGHDAQALQTFIKTSNHFLKLEYMDHALRCASASGCSNNIKILVKEGANIMASGPTSRKTALHFSVEKGHADAVSVLLTSVDTKDCFDPVGQLLAQDLQNKTPVNALSSLKDPKIKLAIIQHMQNSLDLHRERSPYVYTDTVLDDLSNRLSTIEDEARKQLDEQQQATLDTSAPVVQLSISGHSGSSTTPIPTTSEARKDASKVATPG